jgi:hypothetical protein
VPVELSWLPLNILAVSDVGATSCPFGIRGDPRDWCPPRRGSSPLEIDSIILSGPITKGLQQACRVKLQLETLRNRSETYSYG